MKHPTRGWKRRFSPRENAPDCSTPDSPFPTGVALVGTGDATLSGLKHRRPRTFGYSANIDGIEDDSQRTETLAAAQGWPVVTVQVGIEDTLAF